MQLVKDIVSINFGNGIYEEIINRCGISDSELWKLLVDYHSDIIFDKTRQCYICLKQNLGYKKEIGETCECDKRRKLMNEISDN